MITSTNKDFNKLLDATLAPEERRLCLIHAEGEKFMLHFSEEGIQLLEGILAQRESQVAALKRAIALSRIGMLLQAELIEKAK